MAVKDNLIPKCIVCGSTPYKGLHGGIFIGKYFLCYTCEEEILRLESGDRSYQYYLRGLKQIWA